MFAAAAVSVICSANDVNIIDYKDYGIVLEKYIDSNGMVYYKRLKKNPARLNTFLERVEKLDKARFEKWPEKEKIAFWLNVYNGLTLKVLGKVRYVVIINFVAVSMNVVLNFLLIPRYGALGAAIATAASMILHNILKQAGLRLASGVNVFDRQYNSFYVILAFCALGMFLFQMVVTNNIYILLPVGAIVSLLVIRLSQEKLNVQETFPELLRIPMAGFIFGLNNK